jgi:peptidoglycan/xylan/chitin deacetylase (PgdA/CDA1 family)
MTRKPPTILFYHRVADETSDPFSLCVSPARFSSQLTLLREVADVVPLDDLASRRTRRRGSRPRIAVTFDDGYADNLWHALPIAEALDTPITVFVTSRMLGRSRGFWWDRLAAGLIGLRELDLRLEIGGSTMRIRLHEDGAGTRALWTLHQRLRPLPVDQIEAVLDDVFAQLGAGEPENPRAATLTTDELSRLAVHPLVRIGAHTTAHVLLRPQPVLEQLSTITQSKRDLEELIGTPVNHFAYPFGGLDSFDGRTVDAVRKSGFRSGCSTLDGPVTVWSNSFYLPRRNVGDWDLEQFQQRLVSWGIG